MASSTALVVRSGPEQEDDGERETEKNELSVDDITEIFARLPVKSLMRFRCVSQFWYSLILSPNFISMHRNNNKNNSSVTPGFYTCSHNVSDSKKINVTFRFGDDRVQELTFNYAHMKVLEFVKIVGCFNGVVCLSLSPFRRRFALWNPATGHLREIADCPQYPIDPSYYFDGWYCSGFCFDQVTNSFKVVQLQFIVTEEGENRAQVNVFSTATNSWSEMKIIAVPYPFKMSRINTIHGHSCVNGYMHWHKANSHKSTILEDTYILSYDIINEVFERIEMPYRPFRFAYELFAYKGSLAISVHRGNHSDLTSSEVDLWVMNGGGGSNQSWSEIMTCKLSVDVTCVVGFFRKDGVNLVLFYSARNRCSYWYDPVNGETKRFLESGTIFETFFVYSASLASLN